MAIGEIGFGYPGYQAYADDAVGASFAASGQIGAGASAAGAPGGSGRQESAAGIETGSAQVGSAQESGRTDDTTVKPGYKSSPAECRTCKARKYQDGSDENVSFKAATHISPEAAPAAVRGHEGEHVANAYTKAALKGGKVLRASVSIHTAVCPECGRTYVSGGTTSTAIAYPKEGSSKRDPGETQNFNT